MSERITHCRTCQHELAPADWRAMTCGRCNCALGNAPVQGDGIRVIVGLFIAGALLAILLCIVSFFLVMGTLRG